MFQSRLQRLRRALELMPPESNDARRLREFIAEIEAEDHADRPDADRAKDRLRKAEAIVDISEARRA